MGPCQYPQCTRADFGQEAVGRSPHCDHSQPQDATTDEPNNLHGTMKSRMVAELMVSKSPIHILKSCPSQDVNESVACFEEAQ